MLANDEEVQLAPCHFVLSMAIVAKVVEYILSIILELEALSLLLVYKFNHYKMCMFRLPNLK